MGLALMLGCSPAQRRTAGGGLAVFGLVTASGGAVLLDPCLIEPKERREARGPYDPSCHETTKPRFAEGGAALLATGVSFLALGGLLYLSGSHVSLPKPRPWHFNTPVRP